MPNFNISGKTYVRQGVTSAEGTATGALPYQLGTKGEIVLQPEQITGEVALDMGTESRPALGGLWVVDVPDWGLSEEVPIALSRSSDGKYRGSFQTKTIPSRLRALCEDGSQPRASGQASLSALGVGGERVSLARTCRT